MMGREPGPALEINLYLRIDEPQPPIGDWLKTQLAKLAALAGVEKGQITIVLVNNQQMTQLHQRYKKTHGTTDVLTFDLRETETCALEGDIVICVDEAAHQAAARGHTLRLEVLLYALHGLLHLTGYDDTEPEAAAAMHRREDQLLIAAGIGAVFERDDK